jgi:hypothetical protein
MKDPTITEAREMVCAASNDAEEARSKLDPRLLRIYEQRLDYLEYCKKTLERVLE